MYARVGLYKYVYSFIIGGSIEGIVKNYRYICREKYNTTQ